MRAEHQRFVFALEEKQSVARSIEVSPSKKTPHYRRLVIPKERLPGSEK